MKGGVGSLQQGMRLACGRRILGTVSSGGVYTFCAGCPKAKAPPPGSGGGGSSSRCRRNGSESSAKGSSTSGGKGISGRSPDTLVRDTAAGTLSPWIPFMWLRFASSAWDLSSSVCDTAQSQLL